MFAENSVDKRMFERVVCSLEGDYASSSGEGALLCHDISAQGAQLGLAEPLVINDRVNLKLIAKKVSLLSVSGRIRWCERVRNSWRAGVVFDKPLFVPWERLLG